MGVSFVLHWAVNVDLLRYDEVFFETKRRTKIAEADQIILFRKIGTNVIFQSFAAVQTVIAKQIIKDKESVFVYQITLSGLKDIESKPTIEDLAFSLLLVSNFRLGLRSTKWVESLITIDLD
mgnify:CR=1 FL=1